ncbi:uncharacterized protein LOC110836176 [Zootermopsis nevadensis]|nr:uncharacterized protein LOC110836176 [Zootermopsis nevadensis]
MVSHAVFVLPVCALLQTASPTHCNRDLQVQESRNFISDARVKSIKDILLLRDNYSANAPQNSLSNVLHHGYRPHQEDINRPFMHQQPRSESSRYRPRQQTQSYEIYEKPDLPDSNPQQNIFLQPSYAWIPDSTSSKINMNLQEIRPSISESNLSYYPYIIMRSQEDGKKQKIKSSVPGVKLAHQGAPTHLQGNAGVSPSSHVSRGQYLQALTLLPGQILEHPQIPHSSVISA